MGRLVPYLCEGCVGTQVGVWVIDRHADGTADLLAVGGGCADAANEDDDGAWSAHRDLADPHLPLHSDEDTPSLGAAALLAWDTVRTRCSPVAKEHVADKPAHGCGWRVVPTGAGKDCRRF